MMALDPYEQQLLTVFDSYDNENLGSLDKDGLIQLCQTLQLEEQSSDLINCLLDNPKRTRATFIEFKDALLQLLGNMQQQQQQQNANEMLNKKELSIDSTTSSPEREVSPKFVYGSKKYGRRSRPRCDGITNNFDDEFNDKMNKPIIINVQRSNSHIDVSDKKKRKTNYKLKRCTSLPGRQKIVYDHNNLITTQTNFNTELICDEKMLREAWKKLGVGEDGYLNQTELILVCDAIGLHKLAKGVLKQLSYKLTLDINHKISFDELLEALQQDETWTEVLQTNPVPDDDDDDDDVDDDVDNVDDNDDDNDNNNGDNIDNVNDETITSNTGQLCSDSITYQYIQHGPNGDGFINTSALIEMWEIVGITSPKELIHELGFNNCEINIIDLANVLDKEIKGMNEMNRHPNNDLQCPHIVLLQANLGLYQMEIRCLKNIFEQMQAEREKLKFDVLEANNRAKLLAQEVDDNHIRMEQNTQNHVKLLEQRHNDIIKDIQIQYTNDKEQLTIINQNLEMKINNLEQEIIKLKNDLDVTHTYAMNLEKENQTYNNKIYELKHIRDALTNQIKLLEIEKTKYNELENEKIEPLLKQLTDIQLENSKLRDKNDEMVTEIENLTKQIHTIKMKVINNNNNNNQQNPDENISVINEGVGLVGAKRRSDYSPTKDNILFGIADVVSPRLGKLRKFQKDNLTFETNHIDVDCDDMHFKTTNTDINTEIIQLQNRIVVLEQVLQQHSITIPNNDTVDKETTSSTVGHLTERIKELEIILNKLIEIKIMINKNGLNCDTLKIVGDHLETLLTNIDIKQTNDVSTETDDRIEIEITDSLNHIIVKYQNQNDELSKKCHELENCLELLRNEYEKCEDYWQSKLDEERQIFELEQHQNTEKLNELIEKMSEYEEQFTNHDVIDDDDHDHRLPPIEENDNLEKQFTDLEQEFEDYKINCEHQLDQKDEEIANLKQKLNELTLIRNHCDIGIQTQNNDELLLIDKMKFNNLSLCLIETTNLYSNDATPPTTTTATTKEAQFNWNKDSQPNQQQQDSTITQPSTSTSSTTPCRPKRTRKHERNNQLYKKHNQDKDDKKTNENLHQEQQQQQQQQMIVVPITIVHNLNSRLHHLEQRCRQLQLILKQQHFFTEQSLNQCRQHHRGEKTELQFILKNQQEKLDQQIRMCNEQLERLARSDLLVKELYVENSYLIAKVQRLEQQCHFLAQCNSNSCSV